MPRPAPNYFLHHGTYMRILSGTKACVLAGLILVGVAAPAIGIAGQSAETTELVEPSGLLEPSHPSATGDQILAELMKHNELRSLQLREYSALRIYSVTGLNGKVHAKETVRMEYIAPDKKTFTTIAGEGSLVIRNLVLNRLMETERSAAAGQEHRDSAITLANYTFHFLGQEDLGAHHCFVVEALPKREDKYLFQGKIWIDSDEFAVVRIEGHPAKNFSFWITRADFVRQYEKVAGFWLPVRDETSVDVRFYGKKIFCIEHHINSVNGVASVTKPESIGLPLRLNEGVSASE